MTPEQSGSVMSDLLKGIGTGVAFALALLAVGGIRLVIAIFAGRTFAPLSPRDERLVVFYIGGFAFGGGLVGLAGPYMTSNRRTYLVYGIAGAATAIVLTLGLYDHPPTALLMALDAMVGAIFGCGLAHGLVRRKSV